MDPRIKIAKVSTFGKSDRIKMPSTRKGKSEAHVLFATRILYYRLCFISSYERKDILMIEALLENGKMVSFEFSVFFQRHQMTSWERDGNSR